MNTFLSLVVISYETPRELPRTLYSLSPHFQQGVSADDYEVIVVDNGSKTPPSADDFADLGLDLSVVTMDDPTPSPTRAVNRGLDVSCGGAIGVFIDGARIASPGLVRRASEALGIGPRAVVGTRGRYLGPMMQRHAMKHGYDQHVEDELLDRIDWKRNGYDLFSISVFDEVSGPRWHGQVSESNSLFMARALWHELGGYDDSFVSPGGGFANIDMWERACALPDVTPILLLGEATFHQFHGGVATNVPSSKVESFRREFIALRGHDHRRPTIPVSLWGAFTVTPPDEELWRGPTSKPAERMADGPMKGLLVLPPPAGESNDRSGVGRSLRASARSLPHRAVTTARSLPRAVWRRLPAPVRRRVKRLLRR